MKSITIIPYEGPGISKKTRWAEYVLGVGGGFARGEEHLLKLGLRGNSVLCCRTIFDVEVDKSNYSLLVRIRPSRSFRARLSLSLNAGT